MKRISITLLLFGLFVAATASAENVYRWVDKDGITRYGRTLPPEYANQRHEILNSAGIVIDTIDPSIEPEQTEIKEAVEEETNEVEPLFTDREIRVRSDNLLMLRYHSEEELQEAMENEVAQLGYDSRLIHQSQASAISSLAAQVNNAANRQRAGLEEDRELSRKIHNLRHRLRRSEKSLAGLKAREQSIRATFERDLERYRYLANGGSPGTSELN